MFVGNKSEIIRTTLALYHPPQNKKMCLDDGFRETVDLISPIIFKSTY